MLKRAWSIFQIVFNKVTDLLPYFIVVYLAWGWIPVAYKHFQVEGQPASGFSVQTMARPEEASLAVSNFDSVTAPKPLLVAFWATWCGPCTFELGRIQSMIDKGDIKAESVLAITDESDAELVRKTAAERKYTFPVAQDTTREISRLYNVTGTPTLVVLNEQNEIAWITSGLSPSLELRLHSLFQSSR